MDDADCGCIFPNDENVVPSALLSKITQFRIFDAGGKLMIAENKAFQNNLAEININGLSAGVYIIRIFSGDESQFGLKFIVQ